MFATLLFIISIIALSNFIWFNKRQNNYLFQLITGFCFVFSWVMIVMWITSLVEVWQIALSTPASNNASLALGSRLILNLLREMVNLLPISRLTLGVLYALPILLIPLILSVVKRSQVMLILNYSTLINLLFFGTQVIVDKGIPVSFTKISIQGSIFLTTYFLASFVLIQQRRLNEVIRLK